MSGNQQQEQDPRQRPAVTPPQWQQRMAQQYPQQPSQQQSYDYRQPQYPVQDYGRPQPGYQQQPPPGYQNPWQQQPRRRRRTGRAIFVLVVGIIGGIIAVVVASNSGDHTISTTGTGGDSAAAATKTAGIGSAITLAGDDNGEQMSVTVTKVITTAAPADDFSAAPAGDRLYAVQFRLRDTGSEAYSDAPDNSAAVVDANGQSYQSAIDNATGCPSFGGTENIAPGSSGLGCVVFEVPKAAKITEVQFTLDSGMGPQTGQWTVKP